MLGRGRLGNYRAVGSPGVRGGIARSIGWWGCMIEIGEGGNTNQAGIHVVVIDMESLGSSENRHLVFYFIGREGGGSMRGPEN